MPETYHAKPYDDEGILVQNVLRNFTHKFVFIRDNMFDVLSCFVNLKREC